ncbi:hypothetical protein GWM83_03900 [Candidatus Bathyarchaeota archaeon]|nr:hypothetical protein [Candidatus Bathyarchaeota archaeon]NIW15824.1 hypothetical protein [Candidatus Bathyarchaeota archaeon]NIW34684.1 hypothetical protein [Candidatus Bathyarchaeota archaeon]
MKRNSLAPLISISVGILILIHHLIYWRILFDPKDVLHHEFFAAVFIAFGTGAFLFRAEGSS